MDLNWEKLVKRYVWNDERTPYFTRVAHLTRRQAHYELLAYSLFMGVLFGVLSVAALSSGLPHGDSALVSIYAFTVCCAAVMLGMTRHPWAAAWCAGAPFAAFAYFALYGFDPQFGLFDKVVVVGVVVALLVYGRRVIAVARAWPGTADTASQD
jgi:hypothetical protein